MLGELQQGDCRAFSILLFLQEAKKAGRMFTTMSKNVILDAHELEHLRGNSPFQE